MAACIPRPLLELDGEIVKLTLLEVAINPIHWRFAGVFPQKSGGTALCPHPAVEPIYPLNPQLIQVSSIVEDG